MMIKVGIIGCGNMGTAIANRLKDKYAVCVFDQDRNKISVLKNITTVDTSKELFEQSEIIILAVKPQDFKVLLNEIKLFVEGKLIISIAAGVTTRYLKSYLGEKTRIIRVMPNMPAQINQGVSVLLKDSNFIEQEPDLAWQAAWQIFSYFGWELAVDKEEMINAATAVSGSGPAFFCYHIKDKINADKGRGEFIKNLTQAAVNLGFDQREAEFISEKTVDGTIAMLRERNLSCVDLIKIVASKGGTTQAGLDVLNLNGSLNDAIGAAMKRAHELEPSF